MRQERCVEQFYSSSKYTIDDIKKELSHKIKLYPKKKADIEITLNENGIYVARISFLFEESLNFKDKMKFFNLEKIKKNGKVIGNDVRFKKKDEIKNVMDMKRDTNGEHAQRQEKKSKYQKHVEKNIVLKPI